MRSKRAEQSTLESKIRNVDINKIVARLELVCKHCQDSGRQCVHKNLTGYAGEDCPLTERRPSDD